MSPFGALDLPQALRAEPHAGEWLGVPMYLSCLAPETGVQLIQDAAIEVHEAAVETQLERGTEIPCLWVLSRKSRQRAEPGRH